jgi:hypothetical protein
MRNQLAVDMSWIELAYSTFNEEVVGEDLSRHVKKEAKKYAGLAYSRRAIDTESVEENGCAKHKHYRYNVDD